MTGKIGSGKHSDDRNQLWQSRHASDLPIEQIAVVFLVAVILIGVYPLAGKHITAGVDNLNFFYPMFSYLGEQLRAGNIPGWNPHQFSGTPFAADPESGWTYLPAMLFFSTLPLVKAVKSLILFHFLLAGLSMYAFARVIGFTIFASLVAAIGFALSGFLYGQSVCCPAYVFVMPWIPLILVGMYQATASRAWLTRIWWWAVAGFGLSQVLAMWLGQGTYYVLLLVGSFTAFRVLVASIDTPTPIGQRLAWLVVHLGAVFAWAGAFAAAGILPRIEFVAASNLASGYGESSAAQGSLTLGKALTLLITPAQFYYAGVTIIVLAVAALWLARCHSLTPYFAAAAIVSMILAVNHLTPIHSAFYLLFPRFEDLHRHAPVRILLLFYPMVALLAGAAVATLRGRPIVAMVVLSVVVVDLLALAPFTTSNVGRPTDLNAYYEGGGAAAFLRSSGPPGSNRYFGYDPEASVDWYGEEMHYIWQLFDPRITALLVNNRATLLRLEDIQGYNPAQLQRYVEVIDHINGREQEYHGRNILPSGLDSPLLDLLSARFIVIPSEFSRDRTDLQTLTDSLPVVYQDAQVTVLENHEAFPRAWIVHDARLVAEGEALELLVSGAVNAHTTALLESAPPDLAPPVEPTQDVVTIEQFTPDAIRLRTRSDSAGMLVLSEIFYPAWKAYVDGEQEPVYVANHALRAVPLPAGEHAVELTFDSALLRIGTIISLLTYTAFGLLSAALIILRFRHGHVS